MRRSLEKFPHNLLTEDQMAITTLGPVLTGEQERVLSAIREKSRLYNRTRAQFTGAREHRSLTILGVELIGLVEAAQTLGMKNNPEVRRLASKLIGDVS